MGGVPSHGSAEARELSEGVCRAFTDRDPGGIGHFATYTPTTWMITSRPGSCGGQKLMRWSPFYLLCFALILAPASGCDDSPGAVGGFAPDTMQGIVVVRNEVGGLWAEREAWSVKEEWRTDGAFESRPEPFGEVRSVSFGPHGQVFVLDGQSRMISVLDGDGGLVRQFGGRGPGPGEFGLPNGMAWDATGQLWVSDFGEGRYTVFDSNGTVQRTVPRPRGLLLRLATDPVFDGSGNLVDESSAGTNRGSPNLSLFQVDRSGSILHAYPPVIGPPFRLQAPPEESRAQGGLQVSRQQPDLVAALNVFRPKTLYDVRDSVVWFAYSPELRLVQRTLAGDTLRIVETEHRNRQNLTSRQERLIERNLRESGMDPSEFTYDRQIVQAIHVLEDGHVLVQIEEEPGEDASLFDVFAPQGHFLGELRLEFSLKPDVPLDFRGDTLLGVTRDHLDVQRVIRAVIVR